MSMCREIEKEEMLRREQKEKERERERDTDGVREGESGWERNRRCARRKLEKGMQTQGRIVIKGKGKEGWMKIVETEGGQVGEG